MHFCKTSYFPTENGVFGRSKFLKILKKLFSKSFLRAFSVITGLFFYYRADKFIEVLLIFKIVITEASHRRLVLRA